LMVFSLMLCFPCSDTLLAILKSQKQKGQRLSRQHPDEISGVLTL